MLKLERSCVDDIIAHANEEYPKECCGAALGSDRKILRVVRGRNTLDSPYEYNIHPEDILAAEKLSRERGWEIIGFYHSHTGIDASRVTEAYPSERDIKGSEAWPDVLYLIVSLADRASPVLRAFRIREGEVSEEELRVV